MKNFRIILLFIFSVLFTNLYAESFLDKNYKNVVNRDEIVVPNDLVLTYVKRFEESANISIWKDSDTSKIYIKIYPISDRIFITNDTHSIKQFDENNQEQTYSLILKDTVNSIPYFDYVYKDAPKVLEVSINENQAFDIEKTFDFIFENSYKIPLTQTANNGTQCINVEMKSGWSLISLPVAITLEKNSSDPDMSMSKLGNYSKIFTYNDGNWTKDPDTITAGQGFWIKRKDPLTVEFCGSPYNPILEELEEGWHLVGTGKTLYNLDQIDYIKKSFKYSDSKWSEDFNTTNEGEGFWLKIGETEDIVIPVVPTNLEEDSTVAAGSLTFETTNRSVEISKLEEYKYQILNATASDYNQFIGKALFIAKTFEGIIKKVEQTGSNVLITTEDATSIDQIYEEFKFSFDGIEDSTSNRSINKEQTIYSYLNQEPLKIKLIKKNTTSSRGIEKEDAFIRIAIPDKYTIQEKQDINRVYKKVQIPIATDVSSGFGTVSFSFMTDKGWSYLDFRLDPKLDLDLGLYKKDGDWLPSAYAAYDYEQTVANSQDIKVEIAGKISTPDINNKTSKTFRLLKNKSITIPVTTAFSMRVIPKMKFGVGGELSGKFVSTYKNSYSKTTYANYDSRLENQIEPSSPVIDNPAAEFSSEFALEASGGVSVTPILTFAPKIGVSKLSVDLNIFTIDAGYEISHKITGKIAASESGVNEDMPFTKNYFGHSFFNPWYLEMATEGQAYTTGKIDLTTLSFVKKEIDLKFAVFPKQTFGKWDWGIMPEPTINEISTKADEKKTVQITFPFSADDYLDKLEVTYGNKTIDFTSGRTQNVSELEPNTKYVFTAKWKDGALTNSDYNKSWIWSTDFEFTTSVFEESGENNKENPVNNVSGEWTLHLKCVSQSSDASVFDVNIVSNSSDSQIISIQGNGTGTDYSGAAMVHVVNGSLNTNTDIANISIATTFPGTNDDTRTDTYTTNLNTNDTGYVVTTQSWYPSGSGCEGEIRLHK